MRLTDGVWVISKTMIEQLVFAIPALTVAVMSVRVSLLRHTRSPLWYANVHLRLERTLLMPRDAAAANDCIVGSVTSTIDCHERRSVGDLIGGSAVERTGGMT
jgi:hypothetical protein